MRWNLFKKKIFSFFSDFENEEKLFLGLDIGTEVIKALIFFKNQEGKITILGAGLKHFDKYGVFNGLNFKTEVIKKTILKAFENAKQSLSFSLGKKELKQRIQKQKKWQVLLGLPPNLLRAKISSQLYLRDNSEKKISKKEEKDIYSHIFESAKKEISQKFTKEFGILSKNIDWISFKIINAKIDGYPIENCQECCGYQGKRLEFKILFIFSLKDYLKNISGIISSLGFEISKIVHPVEGLQIIEKNGIFIDIGGEITQVFEIGNNHLQKIDEFECGGKIFTQILSQTLGIDKDTSRIMIEGYIKKDLSAGALKRIKEIFLSERKIWYNGLKSKFKEKNFQAFHIFLFGGASVIPDIQQILEESGLTETNFVSSKDFEHVKDTAKVLNNPQYIPCLLLISAKSSFKMHKKFFDIIPSDKKSSFSIEKNRQINKGEEKEKKILKEIVSSKKNSVVLENNVVFEKGKKSKISFKKCFNALFVFIFLVLLGFIGLLFFSDTKIEIWPEIRTLTLSETIIIDSNQKENNLAQWIETKVIPGNIFKDEKFDSQKFQATGKTIKKEKARGVIRVYNAYSTSSQTLLINTRFVSDGGKLFRSVKKEVISGGKYEKGKLIPGETDIEVIAAESGEDYNIGPSTFSIPGFSGTPKYTDFYGKSFSSMVNGFRGEVFQVTQNDLDKAKNTLKNKLEEQSNTFLRTALSEEFILLSEAIFQEITGENYSTEAGVLAEFFEVGLKFTSSAIVFKKFDIENFAKAIIGSNISEDETFQNEGLEINYLFDSINIEENKMVLNLEIKVQVYSDINLDDLKRALLGKSEQEIRTFLEDYPGIIKKEINLGPFWRKKIPENFDKVEIKLNLNPV